MDKICEFRNVLRWEMSTWPTHLFVWKIESVFFLRTLSHFSIELVEQFTLRPVEGDTQYRVIGKFRSLVVRVVSIPRVIAPVIACRYAPQIYNIVILDHGPASNTIALAEMWLGRRHFSTGRTSVYWQSVCVRITDLYSYIHICGTDRGL